MKIFAQYEDDKHQDVWPCDKDKAIADLASSLNITLTEAKNKIENSTINNPIRFNHNGEIVEMWSE